MLEDPHNPTPTPIAENFVCEAANRLSEKITMLDPLTIQERLLLLRMCFFFLSRTTSQEPFIQIITLKGTEQFDRVIVQAVTSWTHTNVCSLPDVSIIHLPTKHGGLGFFRQKDIRKLAFSSSVVLCQSVLRSRNILLSEQSYEHLNEFIELCASNLELPADDLVKDRVCFAAASSKKSM